MVSEKVNDELNDLWLKADNLAENLSLLLMRIETLEENKNLFINNKSSLNLFDKLEQNVKVSNNSNLINKNKYSQQLLEKNFFETTTQTNLAYKQIKSFEGWKTDKSHQIIIYEPRIVSINSNLFSQFEIKFFDSEAVVVKTLREVMNLVRPGDSILEISGQIVTDIKQLLPPFASKILTLKLVFSNIYSLPMNFCKILDNYSTNNFNNKKSINLLSSIKLIDETSTESLIDKNLLPSFNLKKGDILQIISCNKTCMQARKVNDLSESGFVPLNVKMERVAMLSPYGRRVIAILGVNDVERQKLKLELINKMSNYFATVVPITSKAPKLDKSDKNNFKFLLKNDFLKLIQNNQMIEWSEVNGYLYGITIDSVRQVIRSGRVCLLDCTEKALKMLYTREFMPYIVGIVDPSYTELIQSNEKTQEETCPLLQNKKNDELINSSYSNNFHLILINKNFDATLKKLIDALENLKTESQWIPLDWLT